MKRLAALKSLVEPYKKLSDELGEILELQELVDASPDVDSQRELDRLASDFLKSLDELEVTTLLSGKHDADDAILDISAGAGGTEACDWAAMLFRMYSRWAERHGFKLEILNESPGDVAGYRGITVGISGQFAYGRLKGEHGVHRLVRISPFDASGRRHTSFAMVDVVPQVAETEVDINPDELEIETFRASGAGGQHVNKTESAVRITHKPSGIVVACQNERSQHKNRASAMTILASRLAELERSKSEDRIRQLRGEVSSADWGRQIRSYVMQPYTLVKDLRTNHETGNVLGVLDGEIDGFIEAFLRAAK
jgi:peptide chain release factor 2